MAIGNRCRLTLALLGTLTVSFMASAQNPVTDWNNIAITAALAANQTTAPGSSTQPGSILYLAYVHLAIYDAVNAIDHRFQSYGGDISAPADASKESAAIAAAYGMLVYLFPDETGALTTQYNAALAVIPDGSPKTDGIHVGQAAASLIIALRTGDGRGANVPYSWPSVPTPGVWIPTPPANAAPAIPWLSKVKFPFTMSSPSGVPTWPPLRPLRARRWADDYSQSQNPGSRRRCINPNRGTETGRPGFFGQTR